MAAGRLEAEWVGARVGALRGEGVLRVGYGSAGAGVLPASCYVLGATCRVTDFPGKENKIFIFARDCPDYSEARYVLMCKLLGYSHRVRCGVQRRGLCKGV